MIQTLIDVASSVVGVLVAVVGAYTAVLWLGLVVWTYQDIRSRTTNLPAQIVSVLLALVFFIPGVLIHLLLRPKMTLAEAYDHQLEQEYLLQQLESQEVCPHCQRRVKETFLFCPYCGTDLRRPCPRCERALDLAWEVCPYCGYGRPEAPEAPSPAPPAEEEVQAP